MYSRWAIARRLAAVEAAVAANGHTPDEEAGAPMTWAELAEWAEFHFVHNNIRFVGSGNQVEARPDGWTESLEACGQLAAWVNEVMAAEPYRSKILVPVRPVTVQDGLAAIADGRLSWQVSTGYKPWGHLGRPWGSHAPYDHAFEAMRDAAGWAVRRYAQALELPMPPTTVAALDVLTALWEGYGREQVVLMCFTGEEWG